MAIARDLLYQTARIIVSKNNQIVVDEVDQYDWYWRVNPKLTSKYINEFKSAISENSLINEKRTRLQYLYDQHKSTQIAALVPNALNFVNVAINARDPLKAVIAISGTALSSIATKRKKLV